jgi:hypothetical protein
MRSVSYCLLRQLHKQDTQLHLEETTRTLAKAYANQKAGDPLECAIVRLREPGPARIAE